MMDSDEASVCLDCKLVPRSPSFLQPFFIHLQEDCLGSSPSIMIVTAAFNNSSQAMLCRVEQTFLFGFVSDIELIFISLNFL